MNSRIRAGLEREQREGRELDEARRLWLHLTPWPYVQVSELGRTGCSD